MHILLTFSTTGLVTGSIMAMFVLDRARAYSNFDAYIQIKYTTGERWVMNNIPLQRFGMMLHIVSIVRTGTPRMPTPRCWTNHI
jgi:hypothetical protein